MPKGVLLQMAEKKKQTVETQAKSEAVYTREELLASAASFGVKPEVIAGALKLAKKDQLTRSEMEEAIKKFMEREV